MLKSRWRGASSTASILRRTSESRPPRQRQRNHAELLDSAKPEFAIISVGSGNSFGLPRTEILARLARRGSPRLSHRSRWSRDVLPRRPLRHAFCGGSSIIGISAVSSSSGGDRSPSAITLLRGFRILFAHQNHHAAEPRKCVLHQRGRSQIAVDARGIEQSFDHQAPQIPAPSRTPSPVSRWDQDAAARRRPDCQFLP